MSADQIKSTAKPAGKKIDRKTYTERLEALGLPGAPIRPQAKPIRQFQLAHLAATLSVVNQKKMTPGDNTALALQYWNAAGKALLIETQVRELIRGIDVLARKEWEAHANALIAYFDDCDGALPGQTDSELASKCYCDAQKKAGRAVSEVWMGMPRSEVLKVLFTKKNLTEENREAEFIKFLAYAKKDIETDSALDLQADGEDRVKASLVRAWHPLEMSDEEILSGSGVRQINVLFKNAKVASTTQMLGANAQVVRWLAVMRQRQLSANMKR